MATSAPLGTGALLVNLGSPQAATRKGVAQFLRPFLLDRRVVELPRLLWWPLLRGVIIPLRAGRVARAYRTIWQEGGSPLRCYTERLAAGLENHYAALGRPLNVRWAVTYGEPGISGALQRLRQEGAETIIVVPLFPQYSATTTAAVGRHARFDFTTFDLRTFDFKKDVAGLEVAVDDAAPVRRRQRRRRLRARAPSPRWRTACARIGTGTAVANAC